MAVVSYALPLIVGSLFLVGALLTQVGRLELISVAAGSFVSLCAARFLHRRSRNLEAVFFSTRVRPTDSEDRKFQCEIGALVGAAILVSATAWLVLVGR
jgi:hypothetical protein